MLGRAPDQGMVPQNLHGFGDEIDRFHPGNRLGLHEEIGESIEVSERPLGVDQARQDLALGLAEGLPCTRVRR